MMASEEGKRPAITPAQIDFDRNEREYDDALRSKVARMVEWSLTTGKPVGRSHFRTLGPAGVAYFHQQLSIRTNEHISAASDPHRAPAGIAIKPLKTVPPKASGGSRPASRLVLPTTDWSDSRRSRVSFQQRAAHGAWLITIVLTVLAAIGLHLADDDQPKGVPTFARDLQ